MQATNTTAHPFKKSALYGGTAIDATTRAGLNPATVLRDAGLR